MCFTVLLWRAELTSLPLLALAGAAAVAAGSSGWSGVPALWIAFTTAAEASVQGTCFLLSMSGATTAFPSWSSCSAYETSRSGWSLSKSQRHCRRTHQWCCGRWPGASGQSSSCSCMFQSPYLGCPHLLCCGCSPGWRLASCPHHH